MNLKIDTAYQRCLNQFYYPYVDFPGLDDYLASVLMYCQNGNTTIIIGYSMIAVLTTLAIGMAYLTVELRRIVSDKDRLLPVIFGFMTASLVMYIFYYIFTILMQYRLDLLVSGKPAIICSVIYLSYTASLFLIIGAILNLSKWIQFLIRI